MDKKITIGNPWEGCTFGDLNQFGRTKPKKNTEDCDYCNGNGETVNFDADGMKHLYPCAACGGTGLQEKS